MRQCRVSRSRRVKADPHWHENGFSRVSEVSISYAVFLKSGSTGVKRRTSAEMSRKVFRTLKVPRTITARMVMPVHEVSLRQSWSRNGLEVDEGVGEGGVRDFQADVLRRLVICAYHQPLVLSS